MKKKKNASDEEFVPKNAAERSFLKKFEEVKRRGIKNIGKHEPLYKWLLRWRRKMWHYERNEQEKLERGADPQSCK